MAHKDIEINKLLISVIENERINFGYHFVSDYDYYDDDDTVFELKKMYRGTKNLNDDIVCLIDFPGGFLTRQVVQGSDNEEYLTKSWVSESYSEVGSIFLDSEDSIDGECLRIYGNTDLYSFERLLELRDREVLKENKVFSLVVENELRYFEITNVEEYADHVDDIVDNRYNVKCDFDGDTKLIIVITDGIIITSKEIGRDKI